jgi:TetR/AcrR family transcriptional regulator
MANSARPRGRPPKQDTPATEDEVLRAALHAFATHGFNGVSVRTLSSELGVSHNLLHQRFGSKNALWHAAVDRGFGNLTAQILDADDETAQPLARLRSFVRAFARYSAEHPDLQRLLNIEGAQPGDRLAYICDTFIAPTIAHYLPLRDILVARGEIRPEPPEILFYIITAGSGAMFTNRALTERLFTNAPLSPERIDAHADAFADLVMNALRV